MGLLSAHQRGVGGTVTTWLDRGLVGPEMDRAVTVHEIYGSPFHTTQRVSWGDGWGGPLHARGGWTESASWSSAAVNPF